MKELKSLVKSRTTVLIAHRLSTVQDADIIYVLDKGRVVESGTHFQLIARPDGVYSNMWRLQQTLPDVEL